MFHSSRKGFTLVELSIVLVILGLLVGGVLAGQSLIHAAELRAVTTEYTNYKIALGAFKEKYMAIPGDMNNAVRFWGKAAGGTADGMDGTCLAVSTAATGTETCNGDGSGLIGSGNADQPTEFFRAFQHLANAGLIEGTYSGVTGPANAYNPVPGTNVPRSKISGAGWQLVGAGSFSDSETYQANYGNAIGFGKPKSDGTLREGAITAADAWNIEQKTDDGKPNTGKVLTKNHSFSPDCADATDAAYDLGNTNTGCMLIFITGY